MIESIDISCDSSLVISACSRVVIAHLVSGEALWRKDVSNSNVVWSLRIQGDVVLVPVSDRETMVLEMMTGRQIHSLPSAGMSICGICAFAGL
jgi:hypothetical protein